MSRENVEVVERMLALLHTGDADGALQRSMALYPDPDDARAAAGLAERGG